MTYLQQRCIVVGGQTSLGPLGQVGMMCSPAVLHAQQLQQQVLTLQQHLLKAQLEGLDLQAELQGCWAHKQQVEAANKVRIGCVAMVSHLSWHLDVLLMSGSTQLWVCYTCSSS
jgi:hypothetical protein